MATAIREGTLLTQRQLNRALLARQLLLRRSDMPAERMIEHLVGMQSQVPNDPYIGLWSRLACFRADSLSILMLDRATVRASLMRGTIHLVTEDDYRFLQPLMRPLHERVFPSTDQGRKLDPGMVPEVLAHGRGLLSRSPMTLKALGDRFAERWPDIPAGSMAQAVRFLLPLVQVTPRGVWGASQAATWALADDWLGTPLPETSDAAEMVRRYLASFGPATVADIQAWSGLQALRGVVDAMRDELVTFRNERGQELFDMPDAPMPDPDVPSPVRFLPGFENALLSHKDRTRIISEERRKAIGSRNGLFFATYLVDGFVAGTWGVEAGKGVATFTVRPFEQHTGDALDALEDEACGLVSFLHPGHELNFVVGEMLPVP